jgi:putative ABC transport system permease protein
VVGVFEADGSGFESEIWGDLDVMAPAFNRNNAFTSITLRLVDHSPAAIKAFDDDLRRNPAMQVELRPEREFYEDQAGGGVAGADGPGRLRGGRHGHRRSVRRDEHDVRHRLGAARARSARCARSASRAPASSSRSCWSRRSSLWPAASWVAWRRCRPTASPRRLARRTSRKWRSRSASRPPHSGSGILFAVMMGILGGLLPALKAARLPITSALRAG